MNARLLIPALALALLIAGIGCNKSGKLSTPSTFVPPAGPVELKLKWTSGERIVQEFDMKMKMLMTIPGMAAPMQQNMIMGQKSSLTVLNADTNGGHEVEMEFLSARMAMDMGRTKMSYDSDKDSANSANPIAKAFGKIIGCKIQYFLDASNNVVRMEGIHQLLNRLSTGGPAAAQLKGMFNAGYFKQMMSSAIFLPPNAVQPGDTWPAHLDVPLGGLGKMNMNYTLTFEDWETHGERKCARIDLAGAIESDSSGKPGPMGMAMAIQDGNTSGELWFDPELGTIIDSDMTQDMTMLITIPNRRPGMTSPGAMQTITNQMSQDMTFKLDSLK